MLYNRREHNQWPKPRSHFSFEIYCTLNIRYLYNAHCAPCFLVYLEQSRGHWISIIIKLAYNWPNIANDFKLPDQPHIMRCSYNHVKCMPLIGTPVHKLCWTFFFSSSSPHVSALEVRKRTQITCCPFLLSELFYTRHVVHNLGVRSCGRTLLHRGTPPLQTDGALGAVGRSLHERAVISKFRVTWDCLSEISLFKWLKFRAWPRQPSPLPPSCRTKQTKIIKKQAFHSDYLSGGGEKSLGNGRRYSLSLMASRDLQTQTK